MEGQQSGTIATKAQTTRKLQILEGKNPEDRSDKDPQRVEGRIAISWVSQTKKEKRTKTTEGRQIG